MAVTDKLKEVVEELRHDLAEVKEQVKGLLPVKKSEEDMPVRMRTADHPIVALQRETNRLFDEFMRAPMSPFLPSFGGFGDLMGGGWPRLDIDESKDEIRITADLAGMDQNDVDLSVADGVLTIRGEIGHDDQDEGRQHSRRERFYGRFSRSLALPADVDLERIEARMKKGTLRITLPRLPQSRTRGRRIEIRSGNR